MIRKSAGHEVLMQTFIDAGEFNKYPVLPWFALALLGSVMATGWLGCLEDGQGSGLSGAWELERWPLLLSMVVRMGRGYGNIFPFSDFGSYSFFLRPEIPAKPLPEPLVLWMGGY